MQVIGVSLKRRGRLDTGANPLESRVAPGNFPPRRSQNRA